MNGIRKGGWVQWQRALSIIRGDIYRNNSVHFGII